MKFARYLDDAQNGNVPTCNDYRGLKKRITAVRRAQEGGAASPAQDSSEPEHEHDADGEGSDTQKRMSPVSMEKSDIPVEPYVGDGEKMGVIEIEREKEKGERQERGVSVEKEKERPREVGRDGRWGSVAKEDLAGEDVDVEKEADAELGDNEDNSEDEDAEGEGEVEGEQRRGRSSLKKGNDSSKSAPLKLSISTSRRPRDTTFVTSPVSPLSPTTEQDDPLPPTNNASANGVASGTSSGVINTIRNRASKVRVRSNTFTTLHTRSRSTLAPNLFSSTSPNPANPNANTPPNAHNLSTSRSSMFFPTANPPTLSELLTRMSSSPAQVAYIEKLEHELAKIEAFYLAREGEARERGRVLREQLRELGDHRREAHPPNHHPWSLPFIPLPGSQTSRLVRRAVHRHHASSVAGPLEEREKDEPELTIFGGGSGEPDAEKDGEAEVDGLAGGVANDVPMEPRANGNGHWRGKDRDSSRDREASGSGNGGHANGNGNGLGNGKHTNGKLNPEEYQHARKRLKKAVLEYYRGLEVLNNYRILNLTGFRKALKKFEKITKIPLQQPYMKERVELSAFASDETVQALLKDMEDQFAARFTRGDKKKALYRLRAEGSRKTHHFSSFRTGAMLGLAIPALVSGIYQTRDESEDPVEPVIVHLCYPVHAGNLLVFGGAESVGVERFEDQLRVYIREYFEIPAIACASLCYAFWLSFARIGGDSVSATIWPLVWLLFMLVLMVNPIPVLSRSTRFWFLRNVGRLLTSGLHRVEFADFWLGDQFCSLVFSVSNIWFIGCAYSIGFEDDKPWDHCQVSNQWAVHFVLSALPFLIRLVQSIRRYSDSGLITHLINGGKYATGIVYLLIYHIWRHNGRGRGVDFVFFVLLGSIYAIYASSWDLLMDWSIMKPHARYPFLRPELLYSSYIPLYYFAIVTNILIRFIWVLYIPDAGPGMPFRTWITGMLEILRRWQWNFYRLENEHLGNMDQYRITREVPLPYSFDDVLPESDEDETGISGVGRISGAKGAKKGR
ncbi:EXS-domain-containing protein [Stereum hirsutum FP-91666 SS1]|uniref:EXS-domain-containing protein n=1 Tax=Stereum hirsutum (strain FP-91666) TaxID=721885 RepID=UPI000440F64D|nr:EXS-domain-containing protein [Stereum hirsutum FP-91666 SS1]EIM89067.1 EXS-domain-containing protein [Stereum hirsutum FP-91666 SS1]